MFKYSHKRYNNGKDRLESAQKGLGLVLPNGVKINAVKINAVKINAVIFGTVKFIRNCAMLHCSMRFLIV